MTATNSILTTNRTEQTNPTALHYLPGYLMCAGLGLLSGAVSTALVIGLAVLIQLVLVPTAVFMPGMGAFGAAAALMGFTVAAGAGLAGRAVLPNLLNNANGYEIQIVTTVGTLTSLVQTILFIYIL